MDQDILDSLNYPQRDAVTTTDGPLLILAGPGSGKTRVITHRIAYLVSKKGVSPSNILAVTFTNKAAREMRDRLQVLMGYQGSYVNARTFHAFCASVLRRDGSIIGLDQSFVIYDRDDQINLIKQAMAIEEIDIKRYPHNNILGAISSAKSQLIDFHTFGSRSTSYMDNIIHRIYQRYQELLTRNRAVDFDDLLMLTHKLFLDNPDLLSTYQDQYTHILIDEFQDTNLAQYNLSLQLANKYKNICVVGDPDQSIYSWRNADIGNILSFQKDFANTRLVKLEENYRSTQNILEAAHTIISNGNSHIERRLYTQNNAGELIVVEEAYNPEDEAEKLLEEIKRLSSEENYSLNDFAVMYRVNAQSRAIEEGCMRHGIQYKLIGGLRFYQRKEVKDIIAYLRVLNNPYDDVSLLRIVNTPSRGIGQRTIDYISQLARSANLPLYAAIQMATDENNDTDSTITPRNAKSLNNFLSIVNDFIGQPNTATVSQIIDIILDRTGYKSYLLGDRETGQERWENIQELRSTAMEFDNMASEEGLTTFLEGVSLVADIDSLEENQSGITLITLHQAKGLEFPVVFMVGMEEGLLPHIRSMEDAEQIEEERRLTYVGMTRAKERLYMIRAFRRAFRGLSYPSVPSRFLADIPPHLIKRSSKTGPVSGSIGISQKPLNQKLPPKNSTDNLMVLGSGDRVEHSRFGQGIVVSSLASGGDQEVTVAFKGEVGIKKLLLSFAPLKKID